MALDYTSGCVNFRDVGAFVNLITDEKLMAEGRLYRGGKLDYVDDISTIENPASIINLRRGPDYQVFDVEYYHFPISNDYEKYDTPTREVRMWLNKIVQLFEDDGLKFPVLIHCTSGKDRTGVVIAALLKIAAIPDQVIVEEYLLSSGEVQEAWIRKALDGMQNVAKYFDRVTDLKKVASRVRGI
jgi:protein-tyrosine phosphatase